MYYTTRLEISRVGHLELLSTTSDVMTTKAISQAFIHVSEQVSGEWRRKCGALSRRLKPETPKI